MRPLLGIAGILPVNCGGLVSSILEGEMQNLSSTVYAIEIICVHQLHRRACEGIPHHRIACYSGERRTSLAATTDGKDDFQVLVVLP